MLTMDAVELFLVMPQENHLSQLNISGENRNNFNCILNVYCNLNHKTINQSQQFLPHNMFLLFKRELR